MAVILDDGRGRRANGWRIAGWSVAGAVLLVPLAAMQFTSEVDWTGSDFVVAGALIAAIGAAYEFAVRMSADTTYRAGAAVALASAFLLIWASLAVGYIGTQNNPANLMFIGVLAIAVGGGALGRFRARGMARAMTATAGAHAIAGAIGVTMDPPTLLPSCVFVVLWLVAAALFHKAGAHADPAAYGVPG